MKLIRKHLSNIILVLFILAGLCLMLYPTASEYWNSFHQSDAIAGYSEDVAKMSEQDYQSMLEAARQYNAKIKENGIFWKMNEEEKQEYESLLNVDGSGMMGYIEIKKINCTLPIYHGTDEGILQVAVGHLEGTSLPVGGKGTHCVLSGHRGLPSSRLFTDLDQLVEGDTFVIRVLNEILTYKVDQVSEVLPADVSNLQVEEGQDYCTLVTCTPYGVNSHRLLVRGHRVANSKETLEAVIAPNAFVIDWKIVAVILTILILILMILGVMIADRMRKMKKKRNTKE